ncbi:hypothetical protein [Serratia quinivorans]|uniref:hypothetical protein n=1 Tax=Serratia quinivorans TaxID=137545 RepID=UPI003981FF3E
MIAYTGQDGRNIGVEFSSVASSEANLFFHVCTTAMSGRNGRVVTADVIGNTEYSTTTTNDGGNNMETRVAILEADVGHIKTDIAKLKDDLSKTKDDISDIKRDVAVILQKMVDIDKDLSKKPSSSEMTSAITSATNKQIIWTIGIAMAILGLAKFMF